MSKYGDARKATKRTVQTKAMPGRKKDMKRNNAGGFSFKIDKWARLLRFLVLGSEGDTYYTKAAKLTKQNTKNAQKCMKEDGLRFVETLVDVMSNRRAAKQDAGLFCFTMALKSDDLATRKAASAAFNTVIKTGTQLFSVASDIELWGGWGRLTRNTFAKWYTEKDIDNVAYQVLKYRNRHGFTHRDVLRLSHPQDASKNNLFKYITSGEITGRMPSRVLGLTRAKDATSANEVASLVREYRLTWEMVPTEWLKSKEVWQALLESMKAGVAMVRNLGRLTYLGVVAPMSKGEMHVVSELTSKESVKRSGLHPLSILIAYNTYLSGHGVKGNLSWTPSRSVLDALNKAMYFAFDNIAPSGKRTGLFLDVSGSMSSPDIAGMAGISPRIGSAVMALATLKSEPFTLTRGFTSLASGGWYNSTPTLTELNLSAQDSLETTIKKVSGLDFGRTDCSLPMVWALENRVPLDTFIIYTDNETYAGNTHPSQALKEYRTKMGIDARLIVVGMTSTGFSIADPRDSGMIDVVGFDTSAPKFMADFARGDV